MFVPCSTKCVLLTLATFVLFSVFFFSNAFKQSVMMELRPVTDWNVSDIVDENVLPIEKSLSVHIFYYPWYGSPEFDNGKYFHWNHKLLPHWNANIAQDYPPGVHVPPDDIGANFYPALGPYSCRDPRVIEQHMRWLVFAGVDTLVVSWMPPGLPDEHGQLWEDLMPMLLDAAHSHGLKMTFHLEPYDGRDVSSLHRDIKYIVHKYGEHPALFRTVSKKSAGEKYLPLLYFYDSYSIDYSQWKRLTTGSGDLSVRNTPNDVLFIGLAVHSGDQHALFDAGFDGIYTYFASEGFTYGSTISNWAEIASFCRENRLLFLPSVGPGYDDRRVRPWNVNNRKSREDGLYYEKMFEMARSAKADILTITSFNEWHEGTQIEPAVAHSDVANNFVYESYSDGAIQYLLLTRELIRKYFSISEVSALSKFFSMLYRS